VVDHDHNTADTPYRVLYKSDTRVRQMYNSRAFCIGRKSCGIEQLLCIYSFDMKYISPSFLRVLSHDQCNSASSLSIFRVNLVMTRLEFRPDLSGASGLPLCRYKHTTRKRIKDETVVASEAFFEQCFCGFIHGVKRRGTGMTARARCWTVENDM
jgi:hypothetical protein